MTSRAAAAVGTGRPGRVRRRIILALLLGPIGAGVALAGSAADAAAQGAQPLADCHVSGIRNGVRCGAVQVPLDPAHPDQAQIGVRYVVVPAMARRKFADPVFLLAGGPGQSAVSVAAMTMPLFTRLNNRRDIV